MFATESTAIINHENDQLEFRLTRRKYGRKTFTWAEVKNGDRWVSCGDPWPCTTPPKKQLIAAALYARNPDDQDAQDALVSAFATKKKTGARA